MTARAVLVALAAVVLTVPLAFYGQVLFPGPFAAGLETLCTGAPAPWPLVFLFILTAVMSIPLLRRRGLTRQELLVIYAIVTVATTLSSWSVLFYLIPKTVMYYYMAGSNPLWETTFIQHVPLWFSPSSPSAVEGFFLGQEGVPWAEWAVPMLAWGSFVFFLFLAVASVLTIMERQWVGHERLVFPLAQIPLEIIREPGQRETGKSGRLPTSRTFWIGVAVSGLMAFASTLSTKLPALPAMPLMVRVMDWARVGPLAGLGAIDLVLFPWLIAIAYLIPTEVSFSVWFFWLVRIALTVGAIAAGATPQVPDDWWGSEFPAPYYQGMGALIALGGWVLWIARGHLARAMRTAFRGGRDDVDQPMSYRWALIAAAVSLAWLLGFCWFAGCRVVFGLAFVALLVGTYVMFARVRAEAPVNTGVQEITGVLLTPVGSRALRPAEIITLMTMRWATMPSPQFTYAVSSGNLLESFKIADAAQINKRRLTAAIVLALVVSLVLGVYVILTGIYHYGYLGTAAGNSLDWPAGQSRTDGTWIFAWIATPTPPDTRGVLGLAVGGVVCVLLGALRLRFVWWPFHPIGFIAANGWGQAYMTFPFFIAWAVKSLVTRYGGLRLYRQTIPLAAGLVLGDLLNTTFWSFVVLLTRGRL